MKEKLQIFQVISKEEKTLVYFERVSERVNEWSTSTSKWRNVMHETLNNIVHRRLVCMDMKLRSSIRYNLIKKRKRPRRSTCRRDRLVQKWNEKEEERMLPLVCKKFIVCVCERVCIYIWLSMMTWRFKIELYWIYQAKRPKRNAALLEI